MLKVQPMGQLVSPAGILEHTERKKINKWYGMFSTTNLLYLSLFFLEQEEGDRKGGKRKREKEKKKRRKAF